MGLHVTLVSGVCLRPETEESHRRLHDSGVASARNQGGLVRAELVPAVPGVQDETVALLTFANRSHLDTWLASSERAQLLDAMQRLATNERSVNVLSGFPGWFDAGPSAPTRWKQAIVVIVGLIPASLVVTLLRQALVPDLAMPAAVALSAVANVCALTWLVMPQLNRVFASWLYR